MIHRFAPVAIGILLVACPVLAVYVENEPLVFHQPDGSDVPVRVWGDEFYQHVESPDGYTLVRNEAGWICYADRAPDGRSLVPTAERYRGPTLWTTAPAPSRPRPGVRPDPAAVRALAAQHRRQLLDEPAPPVAPVPVSLLSSVSLAGRGGGTTTPGDDPWERLTDAREKIVGLTLLIQFPDVPGPVTREDVVAFCNQPGYRVNGNNGSVFDYYYDVSNGQLEYTNYVTAYLTSQKPKSYYTDEETRRAKELILEGLHQLKAQGFDFSQLSTNSNHYVLALNVFYAGKIENAWSKGLWPHKGGLGGNAFSANGVRCNTYQISNLGSKPTLGTFCHENGHMIGYWPDLYDYDGGSRGVGGFCLMAGSGGKNPMPPNPYLRARRGWETIVDITDAAPGTVFTHETNGFVTYRWSHPTRAEEFYLIESRRRQGRNAQCPDQGLVVWHVDENGNNSREERTPLEHYRVAVMQADGLFQLERGQNGGGGGDLFSAGYRDCFGATTQPDSRWWDGGDSGLDLRAIGPLGATMTFTLGAPPAPVAVWPLTGTLDDRTGHGHAPGVTGLGRQAGVPWSDTRTDPARPGADQALALDGDALSLEAEAGLLTGPQVAAACWLRPARIEEALLLDQLDTLSGEVGWRLRLHADGALSLIVGRVRRLQTLTTAGPVFVPDLWTHVAVSLEPGRARLFVNGRVHLEAPLQSPLSAGRPPLTVGRGADGLPGFAGLLNDLILYDQPITPATLRSLPGLAQAHERRVAYWALNESSGERATDLTVGAHHGQLEQGAHFAPGTGEGAFGGALSLDGSNDRVRVEGIDPLDREATLSAWVRPEADQHDWAGLLFSRDAGTVAGLNLRPLGSVRGRGGGLALAYHWANAYYDVVTGLTLSPDEWALVALSVTPQAATLSRLDAGGLRSFTNQAAHARQRFAGTLFLGRDPSQGNRHFRGRLDEVCVFNYALTPADVEALALGGPAWGPSPADLDGLVPPETTLSWQAGAQAQAHAVYLGTAAAAVARADSGSPEYLGRFAATELPVTLDVDVPYYWRVDEIIDAQTVVPGRVWSFTTHGSIVREVWTDLSGEAIANLTGAEHYGDPADETQRLLQLEIYPSSGDNYGARYLGLLVPRTSGPVTFWIAADDQAELWLSPSDDPDDAQRIARVTRATGRRQWDRDSSQRSVVRQLVAGRPYFLMVLHKEGRGSDHLSVAWQGPDSPSRAVIDGAFLRPVSPARLQGPGRSR